MANRNTEEILLKTAIDLMYEKGYSDTSIRDIGAKAGMSISLVYHYFKDKEELLFHIVETVSKELLVDLRAIDTSVSDPLECLREMLTMHLIRYGLKRKKEVKIVANDHYFLNGKRREVSLNLQRETYELYLKKLKEVAESGKMNDIDPTVVSFSLFGVINWFFRWYREGGRLSKDEISDHIMKLLFDGLQKAEAAAVPANSL